MGRVVDRLRRNHSRTLVLPILGIPLVAGHLHLLILHHICVRLPIRIRISLVVGLTSTLKPALPAVRAEAGYDIFTELARLEVPAEIVEDLLPVLPGFAVAGGFGAGPGGVDGLDVLADAGWVGVSVRG